MTAPLVTVTSAMQPQELHNPSGGAWHWAARRCTAAAACPPSAQRLQKMAGSPGVSPCWCHGRLIWSVLLLVPSPPQMIMCGRSCLQERMTLCPSA